MVSFYNQDVNNISLKNNLKYNNPYDHLNYINNETNNNSKTSNLVEKLEFINVKDFKNDNFSCTICFEEYDLKNIIPYILECGHTICKLCINSLLSSNGKKNCPFCNNPLLKRLDKYFPNYAYMDIIREFHKISNKVHPPNYIEKKNESFTYQGQVQIKNINGKMTELKHGKGKLIIKNGFTYEGEFQNDVKHGNGTCIYIDGSKYVGEWCDDSPHGNGIFTFNSGEYQSYKGNWRKGKFFGLGTLTYKNGTIKETVFIDGNSSCDIMKYTTEDFTIFGKFDEKLVPQGITYRIDCIGNIFHGFLNTEEGGKELKNFDYQEGILYTIGGDKYEGVFFANMLHGQGRCIQSNGDILIGEFQFGRLHGYGKCEFNNKDIYIGNWNQGVIEGEGEIWYGTLQERYKGYFIKALPHGSGTLFLKNGDVYEGEFFKGMMSGKGKYNSIEENYIYEGEFVRNKKYGKGFENFIGKETYCGDFVEGKRSGKGILVKENTETYKGEFKNNLFHGEGILITKKGQEIAGKFEKGVLVKEGKNKDCLIF